MIRKISPFAVAAFIAATGFGVWAAAPTSAYAPTGHGIQPFQLTITAKGLPTTEFVDYTCIFN